MNLPKELSFLESSLCAPEDLYRTAPWLMSSFEAHIWLYSFGFKKTQELDWNIYLDDGSRLTDEANVGLLDGLKYWLIASTGTNDQAGFSNSIARQRVCFDYTVKMIDFLLLNAEKFELSRFGLAALSEDDLKEILTRLGSGPSVSESLFDWTAKLVEFSQWLLGQFPKWQIDQALAERSGISVVTHEDTEEARQLGLCPEKLPALRAALWLGNYTIQSTKRGIAPNSVKISREVYRNSVKIKNLYKPSLQCLSYFPQAEVDFREYEPVPVTSGARQSLLPGAFRDYRRSLSAMVALHDIGLPAPSIEGLVAVGSFSMELKPQGRFRTLPSKLVFDAVRKAIEFHFQYGRQILDGYLRLAIEAIKRQCLIRDLPSDNLAEAIGPELRRIGVAELRLFNIRDPRGRWVQRTFSREKLFQDLRTNKGLIELVYVYFGAVQLVLGTTTARRMGELIDLRVDDALDNSNRWLVFQNRKSTRSVFGLRSVEARPIEPIAARMIMELQRFQKILVRIGFVENTAEIFRPPSQRGFNRLIDSSVYVFNRSFDYFCDYFETPLSSDGKRYYVRQHQLRRFFALLFFHSDSFGGLETLQWMLGHSDLEHVWHYITESISGEVLRGAKSQFIAESLHRNGVDTFNELRTLLKARYATDDFSLVDSEELEAYIEGLLEDGVIEIEPEFFVDSAGQKFRVIVRVRESGGVS